MNTRTWLLWLITGAVFTSLTPHPLYLMLIFLSVALVFTRWQSDAPLSRTYTIFLTVGGWIFLSYILFSIITIGSMRGATPLVALPALTLPAWLGGITLGGPITAEALAWGATRGLSIWTLMALFGTFNALVDHYRLLRLTPKALFHAGLAVTIAVAFVPSLVRSIGDIIEAQRARGHRFRGIRSWLPLVAPLLASSLEKALQLAEALDSRGYGRTTRSERYTALRQIALIVGILLTAGGVIAWLYYGAGAIRTIALAAMLGGILISGWVFHHLGSLITRSQYSRERWHWHDTVVSIACIAALAVVVALRTSAPTLFVYYPFPRIMLPSFDMRLAVALLFLALPALAGVGMPQREQDVEPVAVVEANPVRRGVEGMRQTSTD